MKEIQIEGRTLQFELFTDRWGQKITIFYEGLESYTERKYLLFGEKITKTRPKEIFRILRDVKDPYLKKEWWQKAIRIKLNILNRQQEIEKGILI